MELERATPNYFTDRLEYTWMGDNAPSTLSGATIIVEYDNISNAYSIDSDEYWPFLEWIADKFSDDYPRRYLESEHTYFKRIGVKIIEL